MSSESPASLSRARGLVLVSYLLATAAAVASLRLLHFGSPLLDSLVADCVATVVIFGFSVAYSNSSFYDAYWSVAPPLLALYFATVASPGANELRAMIATVLTFVWGIRLTYNWARGWTGLTHEDFRYVDLRAKTGPAYWLVSFLGIHLFPTFQTFAGSVGLYVAITASGHAFGWIDAIACVVTAGAILIETVADEQLRDFVKRPDRVPGSVMDEGLWAYSRHPNYFGEMSFWWGLALFGLAADPSQWKIILIGPVAITVMFFFVSVPMMETRQLAAKPHYAEQIKRTSMIVPWFRSRA